MTRAASSFKEGKGFVGGYSKSASKGHSSKRSFRRNFSLPISAGMAFKGLPDKSRFTRAVSPPISTGSSSSLLFSNENVASFFSIPTEAGKEAR
jgi:hypothetical protein